MLIECNSLDQRGALERQNNRDIDPPRIWLCRWWLNVASGMLLCSGNGGAGLGRVVPLQIIWGEDTFEPCPHGEHSIAEPMTVRDPVEHGEQVTCPAAEIHQDIGAGLDRFDVRKTNPLTAEIPHVHFMLACARAFCAEDQLDRYAQSDARGSSLFDRSTAVVEGS